MWFAVTLALLIWTAPADAVFLEQARSELVRFLGQPTQIFHPKSLVGGERDGERKTTFAWIRGWHTLELTGNTVGEWQRVHCV